MGVELGYVDSFKGAGLVAFLDILGFSKEIEVNWNRADGNPLDKILHLKALLPKYKRGIDSGNKFARLYPCRIQTVSDSIIISFGFDALNSKGDYVIGMIAFFDIIATVWRKALEVGFTIRGGVDYGDIYWDGTEIIGPSLIQAYKCETSYAKTSRVILSSSMNKFLKKTLAEIGTLWNKDLLRCLKKDIDGFLIVNPHALYSNTVEGDKEYLIGILEQIRDRSPADAKLKYGPLLACLHTKNNILTVNDLGEY